MEMRATYIRACPQLRPEPCFRTIYGVFHRTGPRLRGTALLIGADLRDALLSDRTSDLLQRGHGI